MTIKPIFAWYDMWVGAFWDGQKRRLYILPLPCIGIVIDFIGPKDETSPKPVNLRECLHLTKRYPTLGRWRCMDCGAEGELPFTPKKAHTP